MAHQLGTKAPENVILLGRGLGEAEGRREEGQLPQVVARSHGGPPAWWGVKGSGPLRWGHPDFPGCQSWERTDEMKNRLF